MDTPVCRSLSDAVNLWLETVERLSLSDIISEDTSERLDAEFSKAGQSAAVIFKGARKAEEGDAASGNLETIDPLYFRETRNFVPQNNEIAPTSFHLSTSKWVAIAKQRQLHPHWVEVQVMEPDFTNWLKLQREKDALGLDDAFRSPHWGLVTSLTWIATLDPHLTSRAAKLHPNMHETDTRLSLARKSTTDGDPGNVPHRYESLVKAWKGDLALRLSDGSLSGIVTQVTVRKTDAVVARVEQSLTGVRFPAKQTPGAAMSYIPFDLENLQQTVLRPKDWSVAHSWTEFRDVIFSRDAILALWPARTIGNKAKPTTKLDANELGVWTHVEAAAWIARQNADVSGRHTLDTFDVDDPKRDESFELAWSRLLEALKAGKVRASSSTANVIDAEFWTYAKRSTELKNVDDEDQLTDVFTRPLASIKVEDTAGGGQISRTPIEGHSLITLKADEVRSLFPANNQRQKGAASVQSTAKVDEKEVLEWLTGLVKSWPNGDPPPDKEALYRKHQIKFGQRAMASRKFHEIRSRKGNDAVLPQCWRTPGKRAANWRSKLSAEWLQRLQLS